MDGGPWTFEQNLLVYHKLKENEDPHLVKLSSIDIWVQAYDLPRGLISDNIFMNIGNFMGTFIKADSTNITGGWTLYKRVKVTM